MAESRTLIRFYSSNDFTSYELTCEGIDDQELLKLCSMMEIAKMRILEDLSNKYGYIDNENN